jgi:hypothetical protein
MPSTKRKEKLIAENQSPIKRVTRRSERNSIETPAIINNTVKESKTKNIEKKSSRSSRQSITTQVEVTPRVAEKVSSR